MTFPQNRRHQKTVGTFSGITLLEIDVISTIYPNEQTLYTVRMAELTMAEIGMTGGRFTKYVDEPQEFTIVVDMIARGAAKYEAVFTEGLDWIAQHATESWSFDICVPHLGADAKNLLIWSFKSLNDALLFKLTV